MTHVCSKKIVLLGMMSKMPVPGVVWQTMHYLVGLERMGYQAYYVEAHARTPGAFMTEASDDGAGRAAAFIDTLCQRFGLHGRWAYHALHDDGRVYGMSDSELAALYQSAAAIINLHGGTEPRPEHYATGRLVYLETDPVQLQIELHEKLQSTIDFLAPHIAFFTFGENYGRPDCLLPVSDRFHFRPTRQPVVLDFWEPSDPRNDGAFTTVGNWQQPWRQVQFAGETYHWSKHYEFAKFLNVPLLAAAHGARFELALSNYDDQAEMMLREHGWSIRPAPGFGADIDTYRDFIASSRGEFTVAKDQNIRLRSGWFSDRSATYLAAGRPVITQDTGFGSILPTGEGLFAFSTMPQVLSALASIQEDYARHSKAAKEIARHYFHHEVVLGSLLRELGI